MQGKGIIKFFLVLMTIVCLVQWLFMVPTRKVEKNADSYAQSMADQFNDNLLADSAYKSSRQSYLDSMSSEEIFKIPLLKTYTYQELKQQQLALGLDLKGGMSVLLQVDLRDFLRSLSNDSKDPTFITALDNADKALQNSSSDYITLFAQEFAKIKTDDASLATIFSRNRELSENEGITLDTDAGEMVSILRRQADETVDLTYKMLKERIDKFGVVQPNVSLDASRDLITVELPGIDNPERAKEYIDKTAKLDFWKVYRIMDPGVINGFIQADDFLRKQQALDTVFNESPEFQIDTIFKIDTLTGIETAEIDYIDTIPISNELNQQAGPLLSQLILNQQTAEGFIMPLAVMGVADKNQRNTIDKYLEMPEVKRLFPKDLSFHWSYYPVQDPETRKYTKQYELYAIKKDRGNRAQLEGDMVTGARPDQDPVTGQSVVSLSMGPRGAKIWGDMTSEAARDNNRELAIMLDDEVVSAPRVNEPIMDGRSQISGQFSTDEARDLANILQVGKLPANTQIIQDSVIGPSLGAKNINKSMNSLLIGFIILLAFMVLYYGTGGIVSIIALLVNMFFIFGALASYGTVLTLPGIAGILLTIGMAVDANVIIYERIKEELRHEKSLGLAIADGFKHSYSAIIDANVTTILTAIVLAYYGLGPVKGFAVVLIIGVLCSLFTAVLFGRLLIEWWVGKGRTISFWTGLSKNWFANLNIDWLRKRRIAYVISGIIIGAGLISFFTRSFELGVDFKGGYSYNITVEEEHAADAETLRVALTDAFGSTPVVKAVDTENTFNITTSYQIDNSDDGASELVMEKLYEGVNSVAGGNIDFEQFKQPDGNGTHVESSSKVGPTIADDIKKSSFKATIIALILIFLYILIRFNRWQYSLGAIAALFHDTLVVLSVFSLFHGILPFSLEIDQAFIAALLTVIGYSINDTVVVFDRIREFLGTYLGKSKTEVINMAVNSTVSRTVITSITTLFVVAILFFFGGASIKGFAFALMIGIIVGTYSSIFVATPLVHDLTGEMKPLKSSSKKAGKSFSRTKA